MNRLSSLIEEPKTNRLESLAVPVTNEFEKADEAWKVSQEFNIPVKDTMSYISANEPSTFGKALRTVREFIQQKTGMWEYNTAPIGGQQFREEHPLRALGEESLYYGAKYISGLTLGATDILANKYGGDKDLASLVMRLKGFEVFQPTPEEEKAGGAVEAIGAYGTAGKVVSPLVGKIPAAQALKTILDSGLTFSSVDAALQFSKSVTEDTPIDWSHVWASGGVGVLWGAGEVTVEAVMNGLVKNMDKYWGEKGMDVAEKLRPEGTSLKDQYARQEAEIRSDIDAYKAAGRKGGKEAEAIRQKIRDKYNGTNVPKDSAFAKPEPVKTKGKTAITKPVTKKAAKGTKPLAEVKPPEIKPEMGKPYEAVLFRGTSTEGPLDEGIYGKAAYYSPEKSVAEHYRRGKGVIEESKISLQNPFVGQEGDFTKIASEISIFDPKYEQLSQKEFDNIVANHITDRLKKQGYDGFVLIDKSGNVLEVGVYDTNKSTQQPEVKTPESGTPKESPITGDTEKKPWEMTREEYILSDKSDYESEQDYGIALSEGHNPQTIHRNNVAYAVSQNKPVPRNVLEEYKSEQWAKDALEKMEGKGLLKDLVPYEQIKPTQQPETGKLKGGREAGGTTIINDVASEIASLGHKVYKNPVQMTKDISEIVKRNSKSAVNHIKTLGPAGEKIAFDIDGNKDSIVYQATKKTNIDNHDTKNLYSGLKHNSKENRELVDKIVNGRVPRKGQPDWILKAADDLREILDRSLNDWIELGGLRKVEGKKILAAGSGKAFPQVPNEAGMSFLEEAYNKGESSPKVFKWAEEMVAQGKYDNISMAIKALNRYRESLLRGLNPYLEMARVELPIDMIEWDGAKVLPGLFERNWLTIEGVRKWGLEFEHLENYIEQIKNKYGQHEAKRVKTFIEISFGRTSDASKEAQQICNLIRAYQFQTKVGLSPITILRNMTDRIAKGFTISPMSTIKTFIEYPPFINQFIESSQKLEEQMIKMGAVFGHGSISEGYEAGNVLTELTSSPFTASERGNQVTIALVTMHKMYNDIQRLKSKDKLMNHVLDKVSYIWGGGTKQIQERLKKMGGQELLDKINKGEELTQDEVGYILHTAVKEKAFPMIMSTKPLWYDNHPFIKTMAQFKTWPVRQLNMIWQDVIKYTAKTGDFSRLLAFMTGTLIAGEFYNIMRDFLFDKRESVLAQYFNDDEEKDYIVAVLNDMLDGGIVGMLADFSYGIKDWVTGVSSRTAHNIWDAGNYMVKSPKLIPQALENLIEKEVTPYRQIKKQVDKLDRWLLNEGNITKEYTRWRAEGWEWYNNKQNPTLYKKIKAYTDDVVNGKVDYGIGEDTLAYEMASRQIIVGDVDDAAKYIAYIIDNSDKPIEDSLKGIRGSMKNRAPLGKVAEKDRENFLKKYAPEERRNAKEINNMYLRNYQEAINLALTMTKQKSGTRYKPL